jgi:hypothetical protein
MMADILTITSIVLGIISAIAWMKASIVKVSRESEIEWRQSKAKKLGVEPNLSGITLDGWDMSGTFRAQSFWSSIGAAFAAFSLLLQAVAKVIEMI